MEQTLDRSSPISDSPPSIILSGVSPLIQLHKFHLDHSSSHLPCVSDHPLERIGRKIRREEFVC